MLNDKMVELSSLIDPPNFWSSIALQTNLCKNSSQYPKSDCPLDWTTSFRPHAGLLIYDRDVNSFLFHILLLEIIDFSVHVLHLVDIYNIYANFELDKRGSVRHACKQRPRGPFLHEIVRGGA